MTILRERIKWSIPRRRRAAELTPDEQAGVRRALKALCVRYGTTTALAKALGSTQSTVVAAGRRRAPTVALALVVARVAGAPLSDVLSGAFPKPGECLLCGHVRRA